MPEVEKAAFEQFRETGELPEHQHLARSTRKDGRRRSLAILAVVGECGHLRIALLAGGSGARTHACLCSRANTRSEVILLDAVVSGR